MNIPLSSHVPENLVCTTRLVSGVCAEYLWWLLRVDEIRTQHTHFPPAKKLNLSQDSRKNRGTPLTCHANRKLTSNKASGSFLDERWLRRSSWWVQPHITTADDKQQSSKGFLERDEWLLEHHWKKNGIRRPLWPQNHRFCLAWISSKALQNSSSSPLISY